MKKLFSNAPQSTTIALVLKDNGCLETRRTPGLPLPVWPDGSWCTEVACYLGRLAAGNISFNDCGGTLATYISQLSPLIRYCWRKDMLFSRMDDNSFTEFISEVTAEKAYIKGVTYARRNSRTVCQIGRRCLDFLMHVGALHNISNFVAVDGHISINIRNTSYRTKSGKTQSVTYMSHRSFPPMGPVTTRHMVGQHYIEQLRDAAVSLTSNSFLHRRRLVLLRLLEMSGARRLEISKISVADILAAARLPNAELAIFNAKRRGGASPTTRMVDIGHQELTFILDYIKYYRSVVIGKTIGSDNDHGSLLVSYTTGKPLTAGTLTLELSIMRRFAGISGKAHPHLFRHRFITMSLLALIKAHGIRNRAEFDSMLKIESFKEIVAQKSGHTNIDSLDPYIDAAFIELNGAPMDASALVKAFKIAASIKSSLAEVSKLAENLDKDELVSEFKMRFEGIQKDLAGLQSLKE